jgi:hypothetical protein
MVKEGASGTARAGLDTIHSCKKLQRSPRIRAAAGLITFLDRSLDGPKTEITSRSEVFHTGSPLPRKTVHAPARVITRIHGNVMDELGMPDVFW